MADSDQIQGDGGTHTLASSSESPSRTAGAPWKLTVDKPSKIERDMAAREKLRSSLASRTSASVLSVSILIFVAVLLFIACLVCMTATKVSVVLLSHKLMEFKNNSIHDKSSITVPGRVNREIEETPDVVELQKKQSLDAGNQVGVESVFCMILIIITIPHGLTFFRSLWCGGIRTDRPWPSWSAIFWVSKFAC